MAIPLPKCDHEPMELDDLFFQILWESLGQGCLSAKADGMALFPSLVQPSEALKSGSLLNSFAFSRRINPLTAIPVKDNRDQLFDLF